MSFVEVKLALQNWTEKRNQVSEAVRQASKQSMQSDEIDTHVFPLYCAEIQAENELVSELMKHAVDAGGLREQGVPLDSGRPSERVLPQPTPEQMTLPDYMTKRFVALSLTGKMLGLVTLGLFAI